MKIDSNRPNLDHAALQRLEKAAAEASSSRPPASSDRRYRSSCRRTRPRPTTLSKAANESPDIRTDLVERMRALSGGGELGATLGRWPTA
jgi:hypothetical protein